MDRIDNLKLAIYESGLSDEDQEALLEYIEESVNFGPETEDDWISAVMNLEGKMHEGKLSKKKMEQEISKIKEKYGEDAFTHFKFKPKKPFNWTNKYRNDLKSLNMSGASSEDFLKHTNSVIRSVNAQRKGAAVAGAVGAGATANAARLKIKQMKLKGQLKELTAVLGETINPANKKNWKVELINYKTKSRRLINKLKRLVLLEQLVL